MLRVLKVFDRAIVSFLLILMMVTVLVSTIELGYELVTQFINPPFMLMNISELQKIFGYFFMVLIGLELIETIKTYLDDNRIHVEVVFLVAMIAIARKVIILDYDKAGAEMLFGISAIIISLTIGYYFVKKAMALKRIPEKDKIRE